MRRVTRLADTSVDLKAFVAGGVPVGTMLTVDPDSMPQVDATVVTLPPLPGRWRILGPSRHGVDVVRVRS